MGFLDFNIAEFATRMVRGGGVRGRIRPTLDDGILPIVRIGDWTQAPYRTDNRKFFATLDATPFGVGLVSQAGIENASTLPIIIESIEYTGRAGATIVLVTEIIVDRLLGLAAGGAASSFATGEGSRSTPGGGGAGIVRLPLVTLTGNAAAAIGGGPTVRTTTITGGAANPVPMNRIDGHDFMVPPGCSYGIYANATNVPFSITVRIRAPQQQLPT